MKALSNRHDRGALDRRVAEAHSALAGHGIAGADAGVVLGSGLSSFARGVSVERSVAYSDIPGFPTTAVAGHSGTLILGTLGNGSVLVFSGRVHHYEGRGVDDVIFAVSLLHELGVGNLIITNASGGLEPGYAAGDLMLIRDQVSMLGGTRSTGGTPFSMAACYSGRLMRFARESARESGILLREGVYLGVLGPTYETPAEAALARMAGGTAVGMSTVTEVQTACSVGIDVLGIALITNLVLSGVHGITTHDDVLSAGEAGGRRLLSLVTGILKRL